VAPPARREQRGGPARPERALRRETDGARETRIGFLVYPPEVPRGACVIEDVETEESDGFVTPVE
jgi:hypothetical protein